MRPHALTFVESTWAVAPDAVEVETKPIRGGLESAVSRVRIKGQVPAGVPRRFVMKQLRGELRREAGIYRSLWETLPTPPAARLLGLEQHADADYLYLEEVRRVSNWPWRDHDTAAEVCRALARLHDSLELRVAPDDWDYESELERSAASTLTAAKTLRAPDGSLLWRRAGELSRVVASLRPVRARLLDAERTVIHGDVHPGNVIVRRATAGERVTLIDWARTRIGSPLEDVASWLHSLGCWEWEARRRHDSLLRAYLGSRVRPQRLTRDLRRRYWLASACNGLAGAIRYHLTVLADPAATGRARVHGERAVREWERVMRGAAAVLSASSGC